MPTEVQQQTNWCWAACARMAASAFGLNVPAQCELATAHIPGAIACCVDGSTPACNKALDEVAVPGLYIGLHLVADPLGSDTVAVTETVVRTALTDGVVLAMLDVGTGFHFVLIRTVSAAMFDVADPGFAAAVPASWDDLTTAYGSGSLVQAWHIHA